MGRPVQYHINLTEKEITELKSTIRKKRTSKMIRCRCQIILDLDEAHGKLYSREQCAKSNGVCTATVANTITKYRKGGVAAVLEYKRSVNSDQAKRKVDGRTEARLIEMACGPVPEGHSRWTLRLLEERIKIEWETPVGKDAIGRALKKTDFDLTKTNIGAFPQKKMRNL